MGTDLQALVGALLRHDAMTVGPAGLLVPVIQPKGLPPLRCHHHPLELLVFPPPQASGLFEVNPLGADHPLVPVVVKLVERFVAVCNEEDLLGYALNPDDILPPIREYVVSGQKMEFALTDRRADAVLMALNAIGHMLVFEPEYAPFKERIHDLFPLAPPRIDTVTRKRVEKEINRLLGSQTGQRTTLILGVGRDTQTIREALARGDRVIAVDRDGSAIDWLESQLGDLDPAARRRLVLERRPYFDTDFLLEYAGVVDRCYLIYANHPTCVVAVINTLKPGGILITQAMADDTESFTSKVDGFLGTKRELEVAKQYAETTPVYETPWSRISPSGNFVSLIRRKPDSQIAGRILLRVTDQTIHMIEQGSEGIVSIGLPVETLEVEDVLYLRLCRVGGGALAQVLVQHRRRRLDQDRVGWLAFATEMALLHAWLEEAAGHWPPTPGEMDRIVDRLRANIGEGQMAGSTQEIWEAILTELIESFLTRQLAAMEEGAFAVHGPWIQDTFPRVSWIREGLRTPVDMAVVRTALAFPKGSDYTTVFLGSGVGEFGQMQDALNASGNSTVVVINSDRAVIHELSEQVSELPRDLQKRMVLVHGDYGDAELLSRYEGQADRVYAIYPNRFRRALDAADQLLKRGGRLVFQHVAGDPIGGEGDDTLNAQIERLGGGYTKVLGLRNVRPIIRTATSHLFPAGNFFLVMDKGVRPSRETQ